MADEDPLVLTVDDDVIDDPRDTPIGEAPKEKTPAELQAELAEAQRLAGQYASERDIALEGMRRQPVPVAPATQPVATDDTANRARYEAFLENVGQKQLNGDYKGATQDILQFVDYIVQERTKAAQVPIASSTARQAVRNFEATMRDDTLYPQVADEFKTQIEKALPAISTLQPDMQDQAIEAVYQLAVGQSAIRRTRNGRRDSPLPYATGSPSSGARPATRQRQLNVIQTQYVKSAREAGIPEERIRVVLDSMETPA